MNATDIISTYDLKLTATPVLENPFMSGDVGLTHYYCTLQNDVVSFDFYTSLGGEYSNSFTAEFCLARILEDIGAFRSCPGYAEFCKLIGVEESDGKAKLGYEEIRRMSENLDLVLSQDAELNTGPTF